MRIIFLIAVLFFISCVEKKVELFPEKSLEGTHDDYVIKYDENETLSTVDAEFDESAVKDYDVDSLAVINIITQIPLECIKIIDEKDVCELKVQEVSLKSVSLFADCDKNSIETANELSNFAKNNPASFRGIFSDLAGISQVVNGTQKIVSGIIPRSFKIIEFRFEMPIINPSSILFSSVANYNSLYEILRTENKIQMSRRANSLAASSYISIENISNNDPIIALGARRNLTALLFRKSDFDLIKLKLSNFNIVKFNELRVTAFISSSLDFEAKSAISSILRNKNEYKKLDYDLNLIQDEIEQYPTGFNKDSIVIIYDKNNPIAYETAMITAKILKEKTAKKISLVADLGQRKLYSFDYDVAILAMYKDADFRYLSRKVFSRELSEIEMTNLKYKVDLFDVQTYLYSQQKIVSQSSVSKLEIVKE
jgi:hypothetical protein